MKAQVSMCLDSISGEGISVFFPVLGVRWLGWLKVNALLLWLAATALFAEDATLFRKGPYLVFPGRSNAMTIEH